MQRKIYFLKASRKGFMLIYAIALIVLVSTVLMMSLELSSESSKRTTSTFLNTQAHLLAMSATEYAVLQVSDYNRSAHSNKCLHTINMSYPDLSPTLFDINITIRYIGLNCANSEANLVDSIATTDAKGALILDVNVKANEGVNVGEDFAYHRRTVQKL